MSDIYLKGFYPSEVKIYFTDENTETVGNLSVKDGELHFEGDVDESAKVFLNHLKSQFSSHIDEIVGQRLKDKGE